MERAKHRADLAEEDQLEVDKLKSSIEAASGIEPTLQDFLSLFDGIDPSHAGWVSPVEIAKALTRSEKYAVERLAPSFEAVNSSSRILRKHYKSAVEKWLDGRMWKGAGGSIVRVVAPSTPVLSPSVGRASRGMSEVRGGSESVEVWTPGLKQERERALESQSRQRSGSIENRGRLEERHGSVSGTNGRERSLSRGSSRGRSGSIESRVDDMMNKRPATASSTTGGYRMKGDAPPRAPSSNSTCTLIQVRGMDHKAFGVWITTVLGPECAETFRIGRVRGDLAMEWLSTGLLDDVPAFKKQYAKLYLDKSDLKKLKNALLALH